MQSKIPALVLALEGRPDEHFRWKLSELLRKLDWLEEERARLDVRIDQLAAPYEEVLERLDTIPGVDRTAALVLLAEFGTDMSQFPTPGHLASWAGLCPGNAESAGKRFSGRTRKGDRYVRRTLVQSAWAASRTNDCFLAALFFRTAQRRGLKKAAVAVAHRILIIAWHILAEPGVEYDERGGDHFDRKNPERTARRLTRRLEAIGYAVALSPALKPIGLPNGGVKFVPPNTDSCRVDPAICKRCAQRKLSRCICLVKRKPRTPAGNSPTLSTT